jgi:hypothetical protein
MGSSIPSPAAWAGVEHRGDCEESDAGRECDRRDSVGAIDVARNSEQTPDLVIPA